MSWKREVPSKETLDQTKERRLRITERIVHVLTVINVSDRLVLVRLCL
jgi:hypothetical protein